MTQPHNKPGAAATSDAVVAGASAVPREQPSGRAWVDRYLEPLLQARWGAA
jgi:hypothetical protein